MLEILFASFLIPIASTVAAGTWQWRRARRGIRSASVAFGIVAGVLVVSAGVEMIVVLVLRRCLTAGDPIRFSGEESATYFLLYLLCVAAAVVVLFAFGLAFAIASRRGLMTGPNFQAVRKSAA